MITLHTTQYDRFTYNNHTMSNFENKAMVKRYVVKKHLYNHVNKRFLKEASLACGCQRHYAFS